VDEEDVDGWFDEWDSTARSNPRPHEFAELLAESGIAPLDEGQWGAVSRLLGLLERRDYDAVVELLRSVRSHTPHLPVAASDDETSRSAAAPEGSQLAGLVWRAYWERHRRRVLEAFRPAQREVLAALGLPDVVPLKDVAELLLGRVFPTVMSLELRQHLFDRGQQARVAAGLAPRGEAERPFRGSAAEPGESLSLQIPTVTSGLADRPFLSEASLAFGADDQALVALREAARAIVNYTGCHEVEAVAWLLADELPQWPLLALRSQICRWNAAPPHNHRYTIEVGSGLVSPEEVARFYRQQRDRDSWAGLPAGEWHNQPRAFTAELLAFVRDERPGAPPASVRDWPGLHRLWWERYPQKPYRSWRAMRATYLRLVQRLRGGEEQDDVDRP